MVWPSRKISDRAFAVAAPRAWNQLPTDLKLQQSTTTSRRYLKTFFFISASVSIKIIIIRQFIWRRNMFVKSLQGRRTTYATRIKLMKLKVQNTTVKTDESWADSWRCRVLVQIECRWADCSTPQDQRRRMPGCQDEVWCEGRRGLHELQSGERREWKLMRHRLTVYPVYLVGSTLEITAVTVTVASLCCLLSYSSHEYTLIDYCYFIKT